MATKKKLTKKAPKRRAGPIDPKAFVRWLDKSAACYLGLAECKARLYRFRNSTQPVEGMLVEAIGQGMRWWPDLGKTGCESMPYLPSYLRWLARRVDGRDYEHWRDVASALVRAKIRKAMKRDGIEG